MINSYEVCLHWPNKDMMFVHIIVNCFAHDVLIAWLSYVIYWVPNILGS